MNFDFLTKDNLLKTYRDYDTYKSYELNKQISMELKTFLVRKLFSKYEPYVIRKNSFPYFWTNATHYLMWINPKYNKFYSYTRIRSIILTTFSGKVIKFWENPIECRSVRYIRHFHIIVQNDFTNLKI